MDLGTAPHRQRERPGKRRTERDCITFAGRHVRVRSQSRAVRPPVELGEETKVMTTYSDSSTCRILRSNASGVSGF